jgi:hypothetical protein
MVILRGSKMQNRGGEDSFSQNQPGTVRFFPDVARRSALFALHHL